MNDKTIRDAFPRCDTGHSRHAEPVAKDVRPGHRLPGPRGARNVRDTHVRLRPAGARAEASTIHFRRNLKDIILMLIKIPPLRMSCILIIFFAHSDSDG